MLRFWNAVSRKTHMFFVWKVVHSGITVYVYVMIKMCVRVMHGLRVMMPDCFTQTPRSSVSEKVASVTYAVRQCVTVLHRWR